VSQSGVAVLDATPSKI